MSHMKMKFSTTNEKVDQKVARKCYENNFRNKRGPYAFPSTREINNLETNVESSYKEHELKPVGGIKEVQLSYEKILRIGAELVERE